MALLERDASLAALREYAGQAGGGDGRLALIAGEAGVGKTALVEQLHKDMPDAHWAWGACDGLSTPRPLGPLYDLATDLGGELLDLCRHDAHRDLLFRALLRQLTESGGLRVLVLEDLHWADEATIDLLRFLGRRLRTAPVLLVATFRDDGLPPADPLRAAVGELTRLRSTRRVALAPLSAGAVARLAAGSGLEAAELFRLTGGNPFYVTEVVRAGVATVPATARDAVLARVARLPAGAREVLDAAALVGARIEPPLLSSILDSPLETVDEVLASGLLASDGRWLRFPHEIARLAVAQSVPAHRARPLHRRVFDALRALGVPDDAVLAYHAEAAGDPAAARHHAIRAAERAAGLASHREAMAQYERALRFADGEPPAAIARLRAAFAHEAGLLDRWPAAVDAWESALALGRTAGQPIQVGHAQRGLAYALSHLCRGAEASQLSAEAVATLEPHGPGPELAVAYEHLASVRMVEGRRDEAIGLARRAAAMAGPLGRVDVLSDALDVEGTVLFCGGGDGLAQLRESIDLAHAHHLVPQAARAYANLYGALCDRRRLGEAEAVFAEGIAFCDEHDLPTYAFRLESDRTTALEKQGRWDDAVTQATRLLHLAEASPLYRICSLVTLGRIAARRDQPDVWTYLDDAMDGALGTGEPQYVVPARLARIEAYWLAGQAGAARHEIELARQPATLANGWLRGALVAWAHRLGESGDSDSGRDGDGDAMADSDGDGLAEPYRRQLAGDWAGAAAAWTDLASPYDAALALLDADEDEPWRRALGILGDLGAVATQRLARRRMREAGVRSIPLGANTATRDDPLGLTRREREVLDLICEGCTNAEIAARLVVSPRTVDHHVSAVLGKLHAPSRRAAVEIARRHRPA